MFNEIWKSVCNFLVRISFVLDSDVRRDIYIGVTGLIIAIIIFIAEVISNKKLEIEKKTILQKTKIKENMVFCIFIYFVMYLSSIINSTYTDLEEQYFTCDLLFVLLQIIINIMIVVFMYKTIKMFMIALKLNSDNDYFSEEVDKYIYGRTKEIEEKADKISLGDIREKKRIFKEYIKNNKKISDKVLEVGFRDDYYAPIYSKKSGIISNYKYKKIDSVLEEFTNFNKIDKPCIYISKEIGEKVSKNTIIGYCKKDFLFLFKDFSDLLQYDKNSSYIDDEIDLINSNLSTIALSYEEPFDFDDNDKLLNYIKYLYENNLYGIKIKMIAQLEEIFRAVYKDKNKNKRYIGFLNRISGLAFNYGDYDDFCCINNLIYNLYYVQLDFDGYDSRQVAYDFSNNFFKFKYYEVSRIEDKRYYDNLMSYLFRIICKLLKSKNFKAISVIKNNITLKDNIAHSTAFGEVEIYDFQFVCGIIYCFVMMAEKNIIDDENISEIKNLISWLKYNIFSLCDAWDIIIKFKKYFNYHSNVQNAYNYFNFEFDDHEFLSSWSGGCIDDRKILKGLLVSFNTHFLRKDEINLNNISKDDKNYYEGLVNIISSDFKYDKIINKKFRKNEILDALNFVIENSKEKEDLFLKTNSLNPEKVYNFEIEIKKAILKKSDLVSYLDEIGKVGCSKAKLKITFGINQFIDRELFFDYCGGIESFVNEYGNEFNRGIRKEFIRKIDTYSSESNDEINAVIESVDNLNDYCLITNYLNYNKLNNYDFTLNKVVRNNQNLDLIKLSGVDSYYLIEKKFLPKLQFCGFSDEYQKENIDNYIFYELKDCSINEELRNEIISKNSWLAKIGNKDLQHNYLKKQCRLRVFISFKFTKNKNANALKIAFNKENGI